MILLDHIKEDWLCRLPYRLDNMRYRGLNRPAYTLICLVYYSVKSLILLYLTALFYGFKFVLLFPKFIFWDIWNWIFKIDNREWFQKLFPSDYDEYDDEDVELMFNEINRAVKDARSAYFTAKNKETKKYFTFNKKSPMTQTAWRIFHSVSCLQ